ncbi:protein phosphatase 1 regulatory inhibitor subunit PPP1R8 homolog [Nicotiana tomentosiformis]|uniref:protein phosphatase 1 regulatory inhibitor subunit PPP1R8 homolog n=1 Tax=Nicotiana tomentosiformis TaxID=4098 RepID=UPI00051BA456|nr:protein phosphatase 1 regulatory inhibitor subunit PPP1R8 homolog [Nicotiana tomentosiformis]
MYGRSGLDRFKKAQSLEPFQVSANSAAKPALQPTTKAVTHPFPAYAQSTTSHQQTQYVNPQPALQKSVAADTTASTVPTHHVTHGGGQSTWQPPDWAIEPRPGVYYLEVIKDGEVLDRINLDKRRHIFGRQFHTCDFVLDHQSVSRQHAAVIPHKNGSIYVIDLGSAHGTFVANERLTKDSPVELEAGQSLKFAASTRTYILRKNNDALFPPPRQPAEIDLPPPPDPSDEEAVLAYNTFLNRYGLMRPDSLSKSTVSTSGEDVNYSSDRRAKRIRRTSVSFKDQVGGELVEVVGISDGADVETEPGPLGVKEGSLVGKYESLIETTVIPKGKEQSSVKDATVTQTGVTDKLKQVLNKVKNPPKGGIYDDLYGESAPAKVGSWAYSDSSQTASTNDAKGDSPCSLGRISGHISSNVDDDTDDLFG